jgi:hypothetical protein
VLLLICSCDIRYKHKDNPTNLQAVRSKQFCSPTPGWYHTNGAAGAAGA